MKFRCMGKVVAKKVLPAFVLLGTVMISLALYRIAAKSPTFLSTSSPRGTYTVNLAGQKGRPIFFTNEVRFGVLKNGKPFLSNMYLHSGDSFDLSFELGYPNHRWLDENVLQFYREQYFNDGKPDILIVVNETDEIIKYLKVESVDKFLLFDMQPSSEIKLFNSPPRGNYKGIGIEGEFFDGLSIKKQGVSIPVPKELNSPLTYNIHITDNGPIIRSSQSEQNKANE